MSQSTDILDQLDNYEPVTDREKKSYKRHADSLQVRLKRKAFLLFNDLLKEQKNIPLEDLASMEEYINYDKNGFPVILIPKTVIKKLGSKGYQSDYYFSVNVTVGNNALIGGLSGQVKPTISCDVKVFDHDRAVVKKASFQQKANSNIKALSFPGRMFDKMGMDYIDMLVDIIQPQLETVLVGTIEQL